MKLKILNIILLMSSLLGTVQPAMASCGPPECCAPPFPCRPDFPNDASFVLGKTFCNSEKEQWSFTADGVAYHSAPTWGMPDPNEHLVVTFLRNVRDFIVIDYHKVLGPKTIERFTFDGNLKSIRSKNGVFSFKECEL